MTDAAQMQQAINNLQGVVNDLNRGLGRVMRDLGGTFNDATMAYSRSTRGIVESNELTVEESIRVRKASDREVQTMLEMNKALKAVPGKLMSSMNMFGELLADQTQNVLGKLNTGVIFDDVDRYMNIVRKKMGSATITLDNVVKVYAKSAKESVKQIKAILGSLDNESQEYKDTVHALGLETTDLLLADEELEKVIVRNQKAIAQSNNQINAELKARKMLTAGLAFLGTAILDSAKTAAKYGTNIETQTELMYGVASTDLAQIQIRAKQARLAAGITNDEFMSSIRDAATGLYTFTGNMEQGMKFYAESLNMFRSVQKGTTAEANEFINKQISLAKDLNTTYGVTFEQFQQFNESLLRDNEMQEALLKIDKRKRAAYILEINALNAHMLSLGLSQEAAQEATKAMVALGNMKPMDRFKAAFKVQQAAAFYGMAPEKGAEMTRLSMKGNFATPEERKRLVALSAELNERMGKAVEKYAGTSWQIPAEIQRQTFSESIEPVLQVGKEAALAEGKQVDEQAKAVATAENQRAQLSDKMQQSVGILGQILQAIERSGVTLGGLWETVKSIATTLATLIAGKMMFGSKTPDLPDAGPGGGAGGKGKWGKALGKFLPFLKWGGITGSVLGAGEQAYEGYKHYEQTGKKGEAIGQAAGGLALGAATTGAGWLIGAKVGGAMGAGAGPVGAAVGALAGGLLAYFGADAAGAVGKSIGGMFDEEIDPQVKKTKEMIEANNKLLEQAKTQGDKAAADMYAKRGEELKKLEEKGSSVSTIYEKTAKVIERNGELITKMSAEGKTKVADAYRIQNEALSRLEEAYKNATTDATKESIAKIVDQQSQALDTARLKIVSAENTSAIFKKQIEQNEARLAQLGPDQEATKAQLTTAIQTLNEGLAKLAATSEQGNKELEKIRDHTKVTIETLEKGQNKLDEQQAKDLAEQQRATKAKEMELAAATRQAGACP